MWTWIHEYQHLGQPVADTPSLSPSPPPCSSPARIQLSQDILIEPQCDKRLGYFAFKRCQWYSRNALRHWRNVVLSHALTAMQAPPELMCVHCDRDAPHKAGYSPKHHKIWMCANKIWNFVEFRRLLSHELVHAFDFARAKIDPDNCDHIACTEVRAYNLSHQCSRMATLLIPKESFRSLDIDHPVANSKKGRCLAHRVLTSLQDSKRCSDESVARECTRRVFERCYNDLWPFDMQPEREQKRRTLRRIIQPLEITT
ncbi:unnamed protein product [Vitrella brassicaformis CCMP3155]|uniref:Mitochondrial inner membrane protease ATP23 n=1 Tax=Vitrella brassicaformis (strain CCMP3155) TaxID=1169540 RepID=A0A0G4EAD0_VITBC|nr:unnamed protein product [Vitrella brassicaformis CCMP3155]|mmetsp:Transcript_32841/g.81347  ORF Transcript_32841/g.81347 Transcript_32841/m.81347 type:complete len:257 (-) Transcript_32841:159-929(-)|eukprot:CEL92909.1 unnamed protein product [Vitrella brassicaformis CCMP3155]